MISEWSGYIWLVGLVVFLGWWLWKAGTPLPKGGDKHAPKTRGRFPGDNARW